MIAEQAHLQVHDEVNAFGRVGSVADDVAEAVDFCDALTTDIRKDGLKRFEVSVDVADQRSQWSIPDEWSRAQMCTQGEFASKFYAADGFGTRESAAAEGWVEVNSVEKGRF